MEVEGTNRSRTARPHLDALYLVFLFVEHSQEIVGETLRADLNIDVTVWSHDPRTGEVCPTDKEVLTLKHRRTRGDHNRHKSWRKSDWQKDRSLSIASCR